MKPRDRRERACGLARGEDDEFLVLIIVVELQLVVVIIFVVVIGGRRGRLAADDGPACQPRLRASSRAQDHPSQRDF